MNTEIGGWLTAGGGFWLSLSLAVCIVALCMYLRCIGGVSSVPLSRHRLAGALLAIVGGLLALPLAVLYVDQLASVKIAALVTLVAMAIVALNASPIPEKSGDTNELVRVALPACFAVLASLYAFFLVGDHLGFFSYGTETDMALKVTTVPGWSTWLLIAIAAVYVLWFGFCESVWPDRSHIESESPHG